MSFIIKSIRPFNPEITFNSGQCFRWEKQDNAWQGIAENNYAEIIGTYPNVYINCDEADYPFWKNYFDSSYDYEAASAVLIQDNKISQAVINNKGLILLRQPFFEVLISFIISANNNIPRIKSIINKISVKYGDKTNNGYAFPKPDVLAQLKEVDLSAQGCGYRSRYIVETSKIISKGYFYEKLITIPLENARNELCKFMGVGKKVADCILIYALGRKDAYPVDTWIRKVSLDLFGKEMTDDEIRKKAAERFGRDAALAQQYLFIAKREPL